MNDTKTFQEWANKGHWSNWERKPERTESLRQLVWRECGLLSASDRIGTIKLVEAMLPGLDARGRIYVTGGLAYLRKHDLATNCFERGGKNPHTFGNESVKWKNPNYIDGAIGLEGIL